MAARCRCMAARASLWPDGAPAPRRVIGATGAGAIPLQDGQRGFDVP